MSVAVRESSKVCNVVISANGVRLVRFVQPPKQPAHGNPPDLLEGGTVEMHRLAGGVGVGEHAVAVGVGDVGVERLPVGRNQIRRRLHHVLRLRDAGELQLDCVRTGDGGIERRGKHAVAHDVAVGNQEPLLTQPAVGRILFKLGAR